MTAPLAARPMRRHPVLLLAIVALAAAVRWLVVDRDALWLDEGYSWWDAQQRLASLWTLVPTCDPHPPLYFALLHPWIAMFGDGTVAMRMPSMLFGLASIVTIYFAGRELDRGRLAMRTVADGRRRSSDRFGIGAFAALLFALTPFQVYFSIEARPYALLCFGASLLTLACLKIVRAIETPGRRVGSAWFERVSPASWSMLLAGALVVVWTNNTAVLVLGAVTVVFVALWIFDATSRAVFVPVVAAGIVVAVLWAPDWPLLLAQAREVTDDFWIQKPSLDGITFELHYLIGLDVLRSTWWVALAIAGGLLLIWRRIGWRWGAMVAGLAILPIVFNVVISYAMSPILIARALMGAAPALALALASSVVLMRPRGLRVAAAFALVAVNAISLAGFIGADHVKEPWKPIVARLAQIVAGDARGAPIFVVPDELVMPLSHEAKMQGIALDVRGLPADYPAVDLAVRYPSGKCAPSVIDFDLGPALRSVSATPVVVLLTRLHNTYDPHDASAAALRHAGFALEHEDVYQPGDLRVMRFVRAQP